MTKEDLIRKKVFLFYKKETFVHVILIDTKKFYNGTIKDIRDDFFVVKDKKVDVPIFFTEVYRIEPFERNIK